MNIDINKVNLSEKDIEDWLYENPKSLYQRYETGAITRWIGRQYQLPSGIADLIGVRENGMLVVVEIKNVPINKAAVLQVCRYQNDLKEIVSHRINYPHLGYGHEPLIDMFLVGPSMDDQTFTEAQSLGIRVFQFSVSLSLDVASLRWTSEHRDKVDKQHNEIAARPEWDMYGLTNADHFAQHEAQKNMDSDDLFNEVAEIAREYAGSQHGAEEYSDIILDDHDDSDDADGDCTNEELQNG